MNKSFNNWFGDSEEAKRLHAQESLIIDTTEDFLLVMEELGVNRKKLSKEIGKSKSFVTQVLSGSRNLTLRTLADMAFVLGVKVKVNFELDGKQLNKSVDDSAYFIDDDTVNEIKLDVDQIEQKTNIVNVDFEKNKSIYYQTQPQYKTA